MKKVILLIVIVVLLALPAISGWLGKRQVDASLAAVQTGAGAWETLEYSGGYLSSTARYRYYLNRGAGEEIIIACDNSHGLASYSGDCRFEKFDSYLTWVNNSVNGEDPLTFSFKGGALGGVAARADVRAFSAITDAGSTMEVQPLELKAKINRAMNAVTYSGAGEKLSVTEAGSTMSLEDIRLNGDGEKLRSLWLGNGGLQAERLITNSEDGQLEARDVSLKYEMENESGELRMQYALNIEDILRNALPQTALSKNRPLASTDNMALEDFDSTFSIAGLETDKVVRFYDEYLARIRALQARDGFIPNERDLDAVVKDMRKQSLRLLSEGVVLDYNLSADVEGKQARLGFEAIAKDDLSSLGNNIMRSLFLSPRKSLERLDLNMQFVLPKFLANELEYSTLVKLVDMQLLEVDDDYLRFALKLDQGQINLNGQPASIAELLGRYLAMQQNQRRR